MNTITASDLIKLETEAPKEIIKGLITVGYSIMAGTPKSGKSWNALDFAISVSTGALALNVFRVDQGHVFYAALEDNYHRLKSRITAMSRVKKIQLNEDLVFSCDFPKLSNNGMETLHEYLNENPHTKLVIFDTLGRITDEKKGDLYAEDYQLGAALQAMAFTHECAILVVHHSNKTQGQKGISKVSGTSGTTAAADNVLILTRLNEKAPKAQLDVISRDNADKLIDLEWYAAGWRVSDTNEPPAWGGN